MGGVQAQQGRQSPDWRGGRTESRASGGETPGRGLPGIPSLQGHSCSTVTARGLAGAGLLCCPPWRRRSGNVGAVPFAGDVPSLTSPASPCLFNDNFDKNNND